MEVNKDFFIKSKELTISVDESKPFYLFFGTVGFRYYVINDVTIIPHINSNVKIQFELNGLEKFFIESDQPVNIFQRQIEPYPSIELNVNEKKYIKLQIYNGLLKIEGNCDIIQKPYRINDS